MNTPLNPDALEKASREVFREVRGFDKSQSTRVTRRAIAAYLAAAHPVASSVEELDALSTGAVFLDAHGRAWQKWLSRYQLVGAVEMAYALEVEDYLPARVLYRPTEEATNGR